MDKTLRDFCIFLLVILTAYSVFGLHCYHCASNEENSECQSDVEELKLGVFSKFALNCSLLANVKKPVCALETVSTNGVITKIIRSCSNGSSFSFDSKLPHLQNMKTLNPETNVSICGFHQGLICVSLCVTNMCNGPVGAIVDFNMTSSGTHVSNSLTFMIAAGITFQSIKP